MTQTPSQRRKLIGFDAETFMALQLLARDRMSTIQELADEAFSDLLRKHGRPVDLRSALRRSLGVKVPGSATAPPIGEEPNGPARPLPRRKSVNRRGR